MEDRSASAQRNGGLGAVFGPTFGPRVAVGLNAPGAFGLIAGGTVGGAVGFEAGPAGGRVALARTAGAGASGVATILGR